MLKVDNSLKKWTKYEWLRGIKYDGFEACMDCIGDEEYVLDRNNPEVCKCEARKHLFKPDEENSIQK